MKTRGNLFFSKTYSREKLKIGIKVVPVLILILFSIESYAQHGWQESRFYAFKGGSDVICGAPYHLSKWNEFGSWIETWQNCRRRVWHQEFYSGFIYYWGANGWYREWKEGNFWYFNWYDYPVRVS